MNKKYTLALYGTALSLVGLMLLYITQTNTQQTEQTLPQPIFESVSSLLDSGQYSEAEDELEKRKGEITAVDYVLEKNKIEQLRSYDAFYISTDDTSREIMLESVKRQIDNNFTIVDSAEERNIDRAISLNLVAFAYSETWSDATLVSYIANKLRMPNYVEGDIAQKAGVFAELFSRSIEFYPTQEAYIKRAWFNSRLLLTEKNINAETKKQLVQSIKEDIEASNAKDGMRFTLTSRYYNSYTALAYADVLDFLYQEKEFSDYSVVEVAYNQALSLASANFHGNLIIQDIILMNQVASLYRNDADEGIEYEKIVLLLTPVANHIKKYSAKPDIVYEGILVMLRDVPDSQNQNNAAIYSIFQTFPEFKDIPTLLGWKALDVNTADAQDVRYTYKLI